MNLNWIVYRCSIPVIQQGVGISLPLLGVAVLIRLCVYWGRVPSVILNLAISVIGATSLWLFYGYRLVYFTGLCLLVYVLLHTTRGHRGAVVAVSSILVLLICEGYIEKPEEWHKLRGSFLILVMKLVSLGFDLDPTKDKTNEKVPPRVSAVPSVDEFAAYCLFPSTVVFGPFVTYTQHSTFLKRTPLSVSWIYNILRSWFLCLLFLALSSCVFPYLFTEPKWNKWLAAYSSAASFRYSHYFISFLSESAFLAAGAGYKVTSDGRYSWSEFPVVRPLFIELPRSLGTVVTNWNLPMHLFLKSYVFKPSIGYLGKFGAVLATYIASALLHGMNFQLAAVLLSIGVYAYIENVLRYKLSVHLEACIQDRPCPLGCNHKYKQGSAVVWTLNIFFTGLAMFHLAYLGLMFGQSDTKLQSQGFSMLHTLGKWHHLGFLSHWVVAVSFFIYLLM